MVYILYIKISFVQLIMDGFISTRSISDSVV